MYDLDTYLICLMNQNAINKDRINKIGCILEDLMCDHNDGIHVLPESVLNKLNKIEKLLETGN